MKAGFYLLGEKAFKVIKSFLEEFGAERVSFVVIAKDKNISNDYFTEIYKLCVEHDVKLISERGADKAINLCSTIDFAIGWRWLINKSENLVVLHDSILPKYRGFSPLVNMLINKEPKLGVTALLASSEYDKGDIVGQLTTPVNYPIKIKDAIKLISPLYEELVLSISSTVFSNDELIREKQVDEAATYSLWRDNRDYIIDWDKSAEYICRFIDAVSHPYLGALSFNDSNEIRIYSAKKIFDVTIENREDNIGKIIFVKNGKPCVVCKEGIIMITEAIDENGNYLDSFTFRTRFTSNKID